MSCIKGNDFTFHLNNKNNLYKLHFNSFSKACSWYETITTMNIMGFVANLQELKVSEKLSFFWIESDAL